MRGAIHRETGRVKNKSRKGAAASGAAAALGALAAGVPANAASFTVINLSDSGAGSLRQAIVDANGAPGADTIVFQPGLTGTIILTSGQLSVSDSVDIQGPGAGVLAVSGNNASRVFYLYSGATVLDITISGLTITGGNATTGAGVIDFDENLILDNVTITGNTATGDGAGLWADGFNMNLTVRDSTLTGNTSADDGGGIYVEDTGGPLLIQRTVITGNNAAGSGGGIYFYDPDGDVTLEDSTISGNTATGLGGGVYLYSPDAGLFTIKGTTVSGNSAQAGGGLFLYSPDHGGSIENSTISGNLATAGNGGGLFLYNLYNFALHHFTVSGNSASGTGGGIFIANSLLPVDNSIVANNTAGTNNDLDNGAGGGFDLSFNLVESPGTASITDSGGNIFNQDPQLGPLQNNGGLTETHLPAGASPGVNAGSSAFTLDQRGQTRPVGAAVDMGGVEINPGTIQLTASAVNVNENGVSVTITATRTGGADGAVSVSYATSPGTAASPADYAAAVGTLDWANQDSASKSFQVTIVNDTLDEPDETFTATLSNPTGGAALGAVTSEIVTILDDDAVTNVIEIPTLAEAGKVLLGGVLGLAGLLLLRRRKGVAATVVILSLALGSTAAVSAAPVAREVKASTLTQIQISGDRATIRLQDGTTVVVALADLKVKDRRHQAHGHRGVDASVQALAAGQAVALKVRHEAGGSAGRVRIQIFDSLAQAQTFASNGSKK